MAADWDEVALSDVRGSVDKEVFDAVKQVVALGFRIRKQGHAFALYCPCDSSDASFITVPGSSKRPWSQAQRIQRSAKRCPNQHDLMK